MASAEKPIIITNWKMTLGVGACRELAKSYRRFWESDSNLSRRVRLVVCPPMIALSSVASEFFGTEILLGAQDVFWQEKGPYTGETAASMLAELGCSHVIVGHSERRKFCGETDEMVNQKVKAALDRGLVPIVCVGEEFDDRRIGKSDLIVMRQIIEAMRDVAVQPKDSLIVAYEPVWVIGTGQAIEPFEAEHAGRIIRQALIDLLPLNLVDNQIRIIYGGSVDPGNIREFLKLETMSGALVGTASLSAETFASLIGHV